MFIIQLNMFTAWPWKHFDFISFQYISFILIIHSLTIKTNGVLIFSCGDETRSLGVTFLECSPRVHPFMSGWALLLVRYLGSIFHMNCYKLFRNISNTCQFDVFARVMGTSSVFTDHLSQTSP